MDEGVVPPSYILIDPLFSISITFCVVGVVERSVPKSSGVVDTAPVESIFLERPTIPIPPSVLFVFVDTWIRPLFIILLPFTP